MEHKIMHGCYTLVRSSSSRTRTIVRCPLAIRKAVSVRRVVYRAIFFRHVNAYLDMENIRTYIEIIHLTLGWFSSLHNSDRGYFSLF
jgi:hypothetical protein